VEVDAKDNNGYTALMWASQNGNTEAAKMLISRGADMNAKNIDDETVLRMALDKKDNNMIEVLVLCDIEYNITLCEMKNSEINNYSSLWMKEKKIKLVDIFLKKVNLTKSTRKKKSMMQKYLVVRYSNIMEVLWGKYPGFAVFEAIMNNFCPNWKILMTEKQLYRLWEISKKPKLKLNYNIKDITNQIKYEMDIENKWIITLDDPF
jgi:hypothetical protein